MKSEIRVGRLRKLSKHLRSKHRVHREFLFDILARGEMDKKGNYCGSAGCAVGELPALWPKEWRWKKFKDYNNNFEVVHKSQDKIEDTKRNVIADFFSITEEQVFHLFYPQEQNPKEFGGQVLNYEATAKKVADNIDAFIKKVAS